MAKFLANAPAHVETGEIAGGERTHGHAEFVERVVNRFDAGSFFDKELRFASVRAEHAVADKAHAVANQHANFAQFFRELHAGGDDFFAGGGAAHDFQQAHDIRGAEEVRADDGLRA